MYCKSSIYLNYSISNISLHIPTKKTILQRLSNLTAMRRVPVQKLHSSRHRPEPAKILQIERQPYSSQIVSWSLRTRRYCLQDTWSFPLRIICTELSKMMGTENENMTSGSFYGRLHYITILCLGRVAQSTVERGLSIYGNRAESCQATYALFQ
jgi:hypothetical protein